MTEPTKAAMARAKEIYYGGADQVRNLALELDRVDRIAREVDRIISHYPFTEQVTARAELKAIILPDEPDLLEDVVREWGNDPRGQITEKLRQAADRLGLFIDVCRKEEPNAN